MLDSFHQRRGTAQQTAIYKHLVQARADSLLYDEETFDFVAANFGIVPKGALLYALSYLIKLLNIVLRAKENLPKYKEFGRAIKKVKERFGFTPD